MIRRPFISFRLAVACHDKDKAAYALTNGVKQNCMFQVCLRQKCDLHLDLYYGSRSNVNITIYRCATSYFVAIVISALSFTVYDIFTVKKCIVREIGL